MDYRMTYCFVLYSILKVLKRIYCFREKLVSFVPYYIFKVLKRW